MPRPQRERLILDVAGGVFARSGYHEASMDEIASLADVSKPMVYAYFGSKEELYVAYINRTGRGLLDRLLSAGAGETHAYARLRARIAEFLAFVEEHRDGWRVLFRELSSSRPLAAQVADLREQIAEVVRRLIEQEGDWCGLPAPASDAVAHAIVGAGESLANWWLEHQSTTRDQVTDWYVQLVQAAVAQGPSVRLT